jgi:uncharacterized YigZ family protein
VSASGRKAAGAAPGESRLVIAAPVRHEIPKIEGSRFLAHAARADDAATAMAIVEAVRAEHGDARHHCFAWRLSSDPRDVRSCDADEPAGSAGVPILRRIEGRELEAVVVVVTRWFGGTKLGVGGLMRAYGGAAAACLELAEIVREERTFAVELVHDVQTTGAIDGLLRAARAEVTSAHFAEAVQRRVRIPVATFAAFAVAFRDATRGKGVIVRDADDDSRGATMRAPQR